ncbi:hypothetical protein C7T94_08925 [Pedobacter yulinensis]|uniref:Uncharacterized protein n=1 Tax=Pedobacter yulinensis TaxID=2126353 RepID=A0A2T3HK52_9SPHI|nr:hypothetical protein [Pedobacter yulinensis]PST82761.1 hypothetical protein C7T94_08925 [Pedobacter yulinensis]
MTPDFCIYYQVFLNDTTVTRVSANDFKPQAALPLMARHTPTRSAYSLPAAEAMFYGYASRVNAMEKAKSGAIKHIGSLIDRAEKSIQAIKAYRMAHHTDLNVTLLDANIRKLEKELNIK